MRRRPGTGSIPRMRPYPPHRRCSRSSRRLSLRVASQPAVNRVRSARSLSKANPEKVAQVNQPRLQSRRADTRAPSREMQHAQSLSACVRPPPMCRM